MLCGFVNKMLVSKLSDIAKRAGVSVTAVSIVLNNESTTRVSEAKRALIFNIAKELNYVPNELAKALAERRTRLLGLMVPLRDPIFFNQFIAQALSGIQKTLMRRGYNLLVYSPSGRPGRYTRDQVLESKLTDGLIFINTRSCSAHDINQTIHDLEAANIKFTMINSYYGRAPINYVGVDDKAIGEAAGRYLIEAGHNRIAFLSGSHTLPSHLQLLLGIKHAMAAAGAHLAPELVGCTDYEEEKAFAILDRWFARKSERPSAIFCADDQLVMEMYNYIDARRLVVPRDVSVLGRGNASVGSYMRPRLTAFWIPTLEMGELAADILIDSIEKPDQKRRRVLLPFKFSPGQTA